MKTLLKTICVPVLLVSLHAEAASTKTFHTLPGTVTPQFDIALGLKKGGVVDVRPLLNGCYLHQTCSFFNSHFGYRLRDGSTANLENFSGIFGPVASSNSEYSVTGEASGVDSKGRAVKIANLDIRVTILCRSGRGGGCRKYSHQGKFQLIR